MSLTYATATVDEVDEMADLDSRNFGSVPSKAWIRALRESIDLDRFVLARDDGRLVGMAGAFGMQLTVPGPAPLAISGIACVSVSPSHRRRGVASTLMDWLAEDASSRDEPLLGLTASEGGIYERMGFGVATHRRMVSIDRRRVGLDPRWQADTTTVAVETHDDRMDDLLPIYDRYWPQRPGELSRPRWLFDDNLEPDSGSSQVRALHPDGYAVWSVAADWNAGDPRHRVGIRDLVAVTDEAYRALWSTILGIDLAGEIHSMFAVGLDDPLPFLLTNPRAAKTTDLGDHLWLKVLDPVTAFAARSYRTDDELVVQIADGPSLRVGNGGTEPTGDRADMTIDPSAVGPLLLGGVTASVLAAGKRLHPAGADVLPRADALFAVAPRPHCCTPF